MEAEETMECIQEFPEHYKVILDRLNEQREQDQFTDITLIVDGMYRPKNQLLYREFWKLCWEAVGLVTGQLSNRAADKFLVLYQCASCMQSFI